MKHKIISLMVLMMCFFITSPLFVSNGSKIVVADETGETLEGNNFFSNMLNKNTLNVNVVDFSDDSPGDCIIITYNNLQILIDSGQNDKNFRLIKDKMKEIMDSAVSNDDYIWDFIIYSHGDKDHIDNATKILDLFYNPLLGDEWEIGTIIDPFFTGYNDDFSDNFSKAFYTKTTQDYIKKRDQILKKTGKHTSNSPMYFSASQVLNPLHNEETNGVFDLTSYLDSGERDEMLFKIQVLYNYFDNYELINKISGAGEDKDGDDGKEDDISEETASGVTSSYSAYRNLISVCTLISYGKKSNPQKLLFTGDLEEFDSANSYSEINGETRLAEFNHDLIEGVTFFKAGHHGSLTSNSAGFIDLIAPQYVSITMGPGKTSDYYPRYPSNSTLNHFLTYTDKIYPTRITYNSEIADSKVPNGKYVLYGDEIFSFNGEGVSVKTTNNSESGTYSPNALEEAYLYNDDDKINWYEYRLNQEVGEDLNLQDEEFYDSLSIFTFDQGTFTYGNCTLIKYRNLDIVIDCGDYDTSSRGFVNFLKRYVNDGIIEYLIITHYHSANISQIISTYSKNESNKDGLIEQFKIENIYEPTHTNIKPNAQGFYGKLLKEQENSQKVNGTNIVKLSTNQKRTITINNNFSFNIMTNNIDSSNDENDYSILTLIKFYKDKYLFGGDLSKITEKTVNKEYLKELSNVTFYRTSLSQFEPNDSETLSFINPKFMVIGSPLNYQVGLTRVADDAWTRKIFAFARNSSQKLNNAQNVFVMGKTYVSGNSCTYNTAWENALIFKPGHKNGDSIYLFKEKAKEDIIPDSKESFFISNRLYNYNHPNFYNYVLSLKDVY